MSNGHERYKEDLGNYNWLMAEIVKHEWDQSQALGKLIVEKFGPKDTIDIGCATGQYLLPFKEAGCAVYGVDGAPAAGQFLEPHEFRLFDLRQPYGPPCTFDLCLCIETAEHIEPEYSEVLVESLTRCAPLIFFSAARPGQGGEGHFSERPQGEWIAMFNKFGFVKDDGLTATLHEVIDVESVYKTCHWLIWNSMVLRKA